MSTIRHHSCTYLHFPNLMIFLAIQGLEDHWLVHDRLVLSVIWLFLESPPPSQSVSQSVVSESESRWLTMAKMLIDSSVPLFLSSTYTVATRDLVTLWIFLQDLCHVSIWTASVSRNSTQQSCAQLFSSLWCVLTNELIKTVCSNVLKNQNQPSTESQITTKTKGETGNQLGIEC